MDRRQHKTRKAIMQAFFELLITKRYSDISIQDIIDKADIGRSTFYTHFKAKDDLLGYICSGIFEHITNEHLSCESSHDFSGINTLSCKLTHLLYHLKDDEKLIKSILATDSKDIFINSLKAFLTTLFEESEVNDSDIPRSYVIHKRVCCFSETIVWYFGEGNNYTPEQMVEFYLKSSLI